MNNTNTNKKNVLAELAERLNSPVEIMPGTGNSLIGLSREQLEAYKKAQRIVSVLASYYEPHFPVKSGDDIIDECRAIALERANNG